MSAAQTTVPSDTVAMLRDLAHTYADTPVSRVAVVGNAPLPPSEDRARAIDDCDLVFRVNGFRLDTPDHGEPLPSTVGSKVNVVVFNRGIRATPWLFEHYRDRLYLMVEPGRLHWEPEVVPDWWPADLGWVPVPNREFVLPLSTEMGLDSSVQEHWATTGTTAAFIARTLFPDAELRIAGLSYIHQPEQTAWEHATGEPCAVGPEHLIGLEGALLRGWAERTTPRTVVLDQPTEPSIGVKEHA